MGSIPAKSKNPCTGRGQRGQTHRLENLTSDLRFSIQCCAEEKSSASSVRSRQWRREDRLARCLVIALAVSLPGRLHCPHDIGSPRARKRFGRHHDRETVALAPRAPRCGEPPSSCRSTVVVGYLGNARLFAVAPLLSPRSTSSSSRLRHYRGGGSLVGGKHSLAIWYGRWYLLF